jgi:hypothetical protein
LPTPVLLIQSHVNSESWVTLEPKYLQRTVSWQCCTTSLPSLHLTYVSVTSQFLSYPQTLLHLTTQTRYPLHSAYSMEILASFPSTFWRITHHLLLHHSLLLALWFLLECPVGFYPELRVTAEVVLLFLKILLYIIPGKVYCYALACTTAFSVLFRCKWTSVSCRNLCPDTISDIRLVTK